MLLKRCHYSAASCSLLLDNLLVAFIFVHFGRVFFVKMELTIPFMTFNRLTPRDSYLRKRCIYRYQRILPDHLKDYTNLKLFMFIASVYIAEIHSLLPKIPLLPHLAYFGQLYFSLTFRH